MEQLILGWVANHGSLSANLALLVMGFILYLIRGWIGHVNQNFIKLWELHEAEIEAREARWAGLSAQCKKDMAQIARFRGFLEGAGLLKPTD